MGANQEAWGEEQVGNDSEENVIVIPHRNQKPAANTRRRIGLKSVLSARNQLHILKVV